MRWRRPTSSGARTSSTVALSEASLSTRTSAPGTWAAERRGAGYTRPRSDSRVASAVGSDSTSARSSRSRAVSGQVPRATSTVKTSTATPPSPLTLAARTSMPCRASAPATAESRPGPVGGGDDHPGRIEGDRGQPGGVYLVDQHLILGGRGAGPAGRASPASTRSARVDQLRHQTGLPGAPGRGAGGAAVRLGQRAEQVQRHPVAGGPGHVGHRRRVVEVAPGGGVGEEEVVPHQVHQDLDVVRAESHAGGHACGRGPCPPAVWSPGIPLADVVQQGADQQEVGSLDPVGEPCRQCGGLQEVPIDGIGVVGVALGLVADGGPLGDEPHQEPVLVE